jgi:hypothetical protein
MTPSPARAEFLNAVFSVNDAARVDFFDREDNPLESLNYAELYTSPLTSDGVAYLWQHVEGGTRDEALNTFIPLTALLEKGDNRIRVWGLNNLADVERVTPIMEALGMDLETTLPAPDTDGWTMPFCDPDTLASFGDFESVLAEATGASEDSGKVYRTGEYYGDALVMRDYAESDYLHDFTFMTGKHRWEKRWETQMTPLGLLNAKLVAHKSGKKDGPAFILARMAEGERTKNKVFATTGIGIDLDNGEDLESLSLAVTELGCMAVLHSTHSHGTTSTDLNWDRVYKFADGREIGSGLMREYCREVEKWNSAIVESVEYDGKYHTDEGVIARVHHIQFPKFRLVVPYAEEFVIANAAETHKEGMDLHSKMVRRLAAKIGGKVDPATLDCSRLFYFPRWDGKRETVARIWGGPLLDHIILLESDPLEALERFAESAGNRGRNSKTKEGEELSRWSISHATGFQVTDFIEDNASDRIRHRDGNKLIIECPNDRAHGNAGDTSDTACMAVSAGMGTSLVFTISCRHGSCSGARLTNLDMLGMMLKEWDIAAETLNDPRYMAEVLDESGEPVAPSPAAAKIEKEDNARDDYRDAIAALTNPPDPDEVEKVFDIIIDANLKGLKLDSAICAIKKATSLRDGVVRRALNARKNERDKAATGKSNDPWGRKIFPYNGEFNFDELVDCGVEGLKRQKHESGAPIFSQINGNLVRLGVQPNGRVSFVAMNQKAVWAECSKVVTMVKRTEQGDGARGKFDESAAAYISEQSYHLMPIAPEVIYTPIVLDDGTIISEDGYYQDHNVLLTLNGLDVPEVPEVPTEAEALVARDWILLELLSSFPFWDVDDAGNTSIEPSRAGAFAMILTPFMRRKIKGHTPLHFIHKPKPQTGGTLLASLSIWLYDGPNGGSGSLNYTPSEEEMEKRLVGAIMQASSHLFFDNVKVFSNEVLVRSITQDFVGGRILGQSQIYQVANNFQYLATGNNTKMSEDMRRRTNWIRLNARTPDLNGREFRHKDLQKFVAANRGTAIRHILTLVKYWQSLKCPEFTGRPLASFEDWSKKIGGVLESVGINGFLQAKAPVVLDVEGSSGVEFMIAFKNEFGVGEGQAFEDIWTVASNREWSVWTGKNEDDKRANVAKTLEDVAGNSFAHDGKSYVFEAFKDKDGKTLFKVTNSNADPKPPCIAPAPVEAGEFGNG